ncbi:MAG: hypothetical protein QME45_01240 [Clostridiales bacterium]|nr:hypothetical protein [Clostridiales bacterium]
MIQLKILSEWTKTPVDRRIFGNFIESGFGRQVNGMWSEMLYNRSFRIVPEYKSPTWEWLGLDKEHYDSRAPFWHSGYEEFDWEPFGKPKIGHTCGTHTYKGITACTLMNEVEGKLCGLVQKEIHLQKGREYCFKLFAGVQGDIAAAGLNGFGDTIHSTQKHEVRVQIGSQEIVFGLTTVSRNYDWIFKVKESMIADIRITFSFKGTMILSFASLMPADNMDGWRKDVVEKLKKAAPSVVRFPGGCFTSFYNWESSVGDRNVRESQPSFYWGGLEENDVGLDEFLHLSQLVGFEPQICFNMMTSIPFKARQMVEYLNADADMGMGRLRMLNEHLEPYGVKLFEMDNEPGRKWTAEQYAKECVRFAREMRLADCSIELMMAAYSYAPELLPKMLEIAGRDINYVIYRNGNPEFVEKILPVIREYNLKNKTNLKLVNTEWLPSCHSIEPFEDPHMPLDFVWSGKITNDYANIFSTQQISWNYALNGAHRLLDYMSYGGEFALANFNNMCNTWGQNIIEATKETCYLSCMGQIFAMFARVFEPCFSAKVDTGDSRVFALATKTIMGKEQLFIINHSGKEFEALLPSKDWICEDGLRGKGRMVHETSETSCITKCMVKLEDTKISIPPLSFLCLKRI